MSEFRISQMSLFIAITKEIERQAKAAGLGKKLNVEIYQMDAIAKAATAICNEFSRPKREASPGMGVSAWLNCDDTGSSSMAMAYHLTGIRRDDFEDIKANPHDPSDFGRCHRFFEAVPSAREDLHKMADVSPEWANLVAAWDELTALYLEEFPMGQAPKLYAKMKELGC